MVEIEKVIKRDETIQNFKIKKLTTSIWRALRHSGINDDGTLADSISKEVVFDLTKKKKLAVSVNEIENSVLKALKKRKLEKTREAYFFEWLHLRQYKINRVEKRDGTIEKFSAEKLFKSINKALIHSGLDNPKISKKIMQDTLNLLEKRYKGKILPVENIKSTVEYVLVRHKLPESARFYMLHRYM